MRQICVVVRPRAPRQWRGLLCVREDLKPSSPLDRSLPLNLPVKFRGRFDCDAQRARTRRDKRKVNESASPPVPHPPQRTARPAKPRMHVSQRVTATHPAPRESEHPPCRAGLRCA
jgi:hypothetical protein